MEVARSRVVRIRRVLFRSASLTNRREFLAEMSVGGVKIATDGRIECCRKDRFGITVG